MKITNPDVIRDDENSDEDYSYEDWQGMPYQMTCPYMYNCPFMHGMTYRDEDEPDEEFFEEFIEEPDDVQDVIRPMYRPRCRWPYHPCFYGGRWHCCRRRRPRPRPRPKMY